MIDRVLIGKWRYNITRKLRKRINKVATLRLCLKIDKESEEKLVHSFCGTRPLNEDCPFYVSTNQIDKCGFCLAPNNDKLWHEAKKQAKQFVSPRYEKQSMVVGCYLLIFAIRGLENYKRLQSWSARFRAWQLAQSKIKLETSS